MERRVQMGSSMTTSGKAYAAAVRAFTLVELMAVVAIIGVLSVIAVVSYRKLVQSARMTEAQHIIQAIRVAQESYRAETGHYADIGSTTWCPSATQGDFKTGWNPLCSGGTRTWNALPVHADTAVYFGYKTYTGGVGSTNGSTTAPPAALTNGVAVTWPATSANNEWYVIEARGGDTDGDSRFMRAAGSSLTGQVFVENEDAR